MSAVRPWGRVSNHPLDFASADSAMGHAADLALGLALARPERRVICLNGDGSMLMTLGTLATIVASGAENVVLFVLENGTYEITGNQPIPGARRLDFCDLARAAGFPKVFRFDELGLFERVVDRVLGRGGPVFVSAVVEPGTEGPIVRGGADEPPYLQASLVESARRIRRFLTGGDLEGEGPGA
jgi:thiamine pyrophosphate-dependent acetolactate synthase large subunit-like protein